MKKTLQKFTAIICSFAMIAVSYTPVVYAQTGDDLAKDASTEINVKNADIAAFVQIFSKKTGRNYILDENVKGKVTVYLPGKVSSDEAIRILDAVLALKGFTSVPIGENIWKIIPAKDAKGATIPTLSKKSGETPSASVITRLVSLKYVSAEDMQQLLSQLISAYGLMNAYTGTNSLIIIDFEDNVERLVSLIESLDVPYSNRQMTVVEVQHAEATDIAEKLNQILGNETGGQGQPGGTMSGNNQAAFDAIRTRIRQNLPQGGQAAAVPAVAGIGNTTVSARTILPSIIPDERTNSIIILADEDTTLKIKELITQLDSPLDLSGYRFYVYRCQHANADELASVLSGLSGNSTGTSRSSGGMFNTGSTTSGSAFGGSSTGSNTAFSNRNNSRTQNRLSSQQRTPGQSRTNSNNTQSAGTVDMGNGTTITADPATNSLIIGATKTDYTKILELIRELDIKRRQVLVEAMLLEVGVTDTTEIGTEFMVSTGGEDGGLVAMNNLGNLPTLLSDPTKLSGFSAAAASSGSLHLPGGITIPSQTVLLNAAQSNSNVNVLSAPNILTTDNEEAEIVVGQNVPFLASTSSSDSNLSNTFNQIDRQDVGITLRLTPRISSGDFVTLRVFTEVSNVLDETANSTLGPTTTVRTSETTIIAKDGQMIVIGGLMSDSTNDARNGVPFLKDIPLLGYLFRTSTSNVRRTNLLIFMTPHIIRDQYDARDATLYQREILEDVIAYDGDPYNRKELLNNPAVDRVAEISPYSGKEPSTMFDPNAGIKGKDSFVEHDFADDSDGVIELRVAPKLPSREDVKEEVIIEEEVIQAPKTAASNFQQKEMNVASSDQYYIFNVNSGKRPDGLPFKVNAKNKVGIVLPNDSSIKAKSFFQVGQNYKYSVANQSMGMAVADVVSSTADGQKYGVTDWYILSPYEIMTLGQGPWSK